MKPYVTLARPFTLMPPLLGIISGAICAWGSAHNPDPTRAVTASVILTVALGSICAAFLNAAFGLCLGCEAYVAIRRLNSRNAEDVRNA